MKYHQYLVSVLIYSWLFSGVCFAHQPAGSDGQLQYNDNGTIAGAELYYSKQGQFLDIPGNLQMGDHLSMDSGDFSIRTFSSPERALLVFQAGPYSGSGIWFNPDWSVSVVQKLGVNVEEPQATLDINGYAKLKPYSSQPVSCTSSMRGTIVMNNNYDLCVCRRIFSYPSFFPTSAFRLVRDPGKKCW